LASYFISSVQGREQLNPLRIEMPTWITGETFITAEVIRELHESYFAGKPAVRALINRMKNTASRSAAASVLIQAARSAKLDEAAKKRWAVELISTIVPQEEAPYTSCLTEILAAQAWADEDSGYLPGAGPAKNNAALQRAHEWAKAASAKP